MTNEECLKHLRAIIDRLSGKLEIVPFHQTTEDTNLRIPITFINYPDCPTIRDILNTLNIRIRNMSGVFTEKELRSPKMLYLAVRNPASGDTFLEACSALHPHTGDAYILNMDTATQLISLAALIALHNKGQYEDAAYEIILKSPHVYCVEFSI